jgi:hypothetical protein
MLSEAPVPDRQAGKHLGNTHCSAKHIGIMQAFAARQGQPCDGTGGANGRAVKAILPQLLFAAKKDRVPGQGQSIHAQAPKTN